MPRDFVSSDYGTITSNMGVADGPTDGLTFLAWVKMASGGGGRIMSLGRTDATHTETNLNHSVSTEMRGVIKPPDDAAAIASDSSSSWDDNAWHAVGGTYLASGGTPTTRTIYANMWVDGTKATQATQTNRTDSDYSLFRIGERARSSTGGQFVGKIAWCAMWDGVLSDADMVLLTNGANPLDIRTDILTSVWPLDEASASDDFIDAYGSNDLSQVGSPAVVSGDDPPIDPPSIDPGSSAIAWAAPAVSVDVEVDPAASAIAWAAPAVSITVDQAVDPAPAAVAWAAPAVSVTVGLVVDPAPSAIAWAAPAVSVDVEIDPAASAIAWAAPAVSITAGQVVDPAPAAVVWAAPAVSVDVEVDPAASAVTWAAPAVLVAAGLVINPAASAVTWAAPAVSVDVEVDPTPSAIAWTAPAPSIAADQAFTPAPSAIAWAAPTASVTVPGVGGGDQLILEVELARRITLEVELARRITLEVER